MKRWCCIPPFSKVEGYCRLLFIYHKNGFVGDYFSNIYSSFSLLSLFSYLKDLDDMGPFNIIGVDGGK